MVDLKDLDEMLGFFMAKAELDMINEKCHLNHGIPEEGNPPAVDYLCQNLGLMGIQEVDSTIRIPVCEECAEALYSNEWILFYCVRCHSSQWLYRKLAKREYKEGIHVVWFSVCPKCVTFEDLDKFTEQLEKLEDD
jgi:hypothetical protein